VEVSKLINEEKYREALRLIAAKSCTGGAHCSDQYGAEYRESRRGGECVHHIAREALEERSKPESENAA
jgi:hypothetical protein